MAKQKISSARPVVDSPDNDRTVLKSQVPAAMTDAFVVLVLTLPVLFSGDTMDPVLTPRYIFLGLFILCFLAYWLLTRQRNLAASLPIPVKVVFLLGLGYGLWSILSTFTAINTAAATYETARHFLNIILLLIVTFTVREEGSQVLRLCKALTIVSLIQSTIGILQLFEFASPGVADSTNPSGLMAHRNLFGSAQALLLPFVLFVIYKTSNRWKYTGILGFLGIIISVVISQTRSSWLSTIAVIGVTLLCVIAFPVPRRKKMIVSGMKGMVGIAMLIGLLLLAFPQNDLTRSIKERAFGVLERSSETTESAGTARARLRTWMKSLQLLKDHPITGVGSDNWKVGIMAYDTKEMGWAEGTTLPSRPHNVYLQVACEAGIPGLLLYFGMWTAVVVMAFKLIQQSQSQDVRILAILMNAGLAAFATDCLFSFPTERIEHSLYITLMGGIIMGSYCSTFSTENKKNIPVRLWMTFVLIPITLLNLFIGFKKYFFEVHMKLAKTYLYEQRYDEVLSEVAMGKSKLVTLDLTGDPLELQSSVAFISLKDYGKALRDIKTAVRYNPNSSRIYTTMGVIYAKLLRYDSAAACYRRALKLTPLYDVAYKNLEVVRVVGAFASAYDLAKDTFGSISTSPGPGMVVCEQWFNNKGNTIADIPLKRMPDKAVQLKSLESGFNIGDNYSSRIRGYLYPPQSGNYVFWISGDNSVELWLSPNDKPAGKLKIAYSENYTNVREWNKYPSQMSLPIKLKKANRYYIEVLHKEGEGDDHLSVSWQLPDGNAEAPIAGRHLSTYR